MARVIAPAMVPAMAEGIGTGGSQAKPLPLSMVQVVCGVSNNSCIASNGDLDVSSCNATDSIEHLDYDHTPPCEADFEPPHPIGEAPAAWVMHATGCRHLLCTFALLCDDCKSWYVANPQDCSRCGAWFKLSWEPLR